MKAKNRRKAKVFKVTGRLVGSFKSNPYPVPKKALADRPMYPWHDRDAAHRIVQKSTRAAAKLRDAEI